jgi:hypothetical protein
LGLQQLISFVQKADHRLFASVLTSRFFDLMRLRGFFFSRKSLCYQILYIHFRVTLQAGERGSTPVRGKEEPFCTCFWNFGDVVDFINLRFVGIVGIVEIVEIVEIVWSVWSVGSVGSVESVGPLRGIQSACGAFKVPLPVVHKPFTRRPNPQPLIDQYVEILSHYGLREPVYWPRLWQRSGYLFR